MRRSASWFLVVLVFLAMLLASCSSATERGESATSRSNEQEAESEPGVAEEPAGEMGGEEAFEEEAGEERAGEVIAQGEEDADRIERTGLAPKEGPLDRRPAAGWAGEKLFGQGNDWEPAAATDPTAPFVYMLTTRYSGHRACDTCTAPPYIALKISKDNGRTFGDRKYLCPCAGRGGGQYDPQIETDAKGNVYTAWINGGFRIAFSRSKDHGKTWSTPNVVTHGGPGWSDHPWLAVSPSGQDVYIAFNHADSWIAQSHDYGRTWKKPVRTNTEHRYHYAGGGWVAPNGDVVFSQANYPVGEGYAGPIDIVSTWSHDGGKSWHTTHVDTVGLQPPCAGNEGCPNNHLGGHANLAADRDGNVLITYDGAVVDKGPQYIYARLSKDHGRTWGPAHRVSPGGDIIATTPTVVGAGKKTFRLWYYDNRNGDHDWNVWLRSTQDGGKTWTDDKRISDAHDGVGYKTGDGFGADYGDYGDIVLMKNGETFAVWGEGYSYFGPGGTWYNRTVDRG